MENFAKAAKIGLVFSSAKGSLSPAQVYQLPLTGNEGHNLDELSKSVLSRVRAAEQDSLVSKVKADEDDLLRLEILKFIIKDKQDEIAVKEQAAANATHNEYIDGLIADKRKEQLGELSIEELEAQRR